MSALLRLYKGRDLRTSHRRYPLLTCCFAWWLVLLLGTPARGVDSVTVKGLFANPPREYATAPLWVWNDLLTEQQVRDTMRDLAGQKVKQVFVHPRPGLMTPYLSEDWFRLWKVALNEARNLDMNVWIYDENSYPSGFAGGWVPELMPEARGRGLHLRETKVAPKWTNSLLSVFRFAGDRAEDVSARVKSGDTLPPARYLSAEVRRAPQRPWNADRYYVDLLYPGVTEKFLEVTLEPYRKRFGSEFGKRLPGSFTDEPEIVPAGGLPWTDDLPRQFQKRWGYSLLNSLPSLGAEVGDWRRVRHNFFSTLNELFIERWAKPYYNYCEKHGLKFTGHYWDHSWPICTGVPDNMAMAAWQQVPGIDCLMNQYREDTHAQFGNVRMVKELSSIANQLGRKRTICEIYGAGGWDLRFEDMKRIGDWLAVLGVNLFDEHLSYVTLRGARKRDHPQSFSYHEPWWEAYHVNAGYLARVSCALSQGEQINPILVIEPTTTAWMYQGNKAKLTEIGDSFFKLLLALEAAQVEYDIGSEDVLGRWGSFKGNVLQVGKRGYSTVVLPEGIETLNRGTVKLLQNYVYSGGSLYQLSPGPERIDGKPATKLTWASASNPSPQVTTSELIQRLSVHAQGQSAVKLTRSPNDRGILFHHRRQLDDGELFFLVNTSIEAPSAGTIQSALSGVEKWNLQTGRVETYPFATDSAGVSAQFTLPPSGSLLLFLSKKPVQAGARSPSDGEKVGVKGSEPIQIRRVGPNVLTLDFIDITAGGETRTNEYFYQANQFAWQKNGMERNPWDSAVQFKDELISRKFPPGSGFTASYKFTIEGEVPANLAIVIERPDLYTITCNGQPVAAGVKRWAPIKTSTPAPHTVAGGYAMEFRDWWLDRAFGRIGISAAARVGENVVTLEASPFTMFHELEPAYVLGDFTLKPLAKGFVIAPDAPLKLGKWNEQGQPFFSQGVAYHQQFDVAKASGQYVVLLPQWYGSVAKVLVNGKLAGYVAAPPWECEVTKELKGGRNDIEVVVIGTLKNTLGPHHGNHPLGSAWPAMFKTAPKGGQPPGSGYASVGYGLFAPFVLQQVVPK